MSPLQNAVEKNVVNDMGVLPNNTKVPFLRDVTERVLRCHHAEVRASLSRFGWWFSPFADHLNLLLTMTHPISKPWIGSLATIHSPHLSKPQRFALDYMDSVHSVVLMVSGPFQHLPRERAQSRASRDSRRTA